MRAMSRSMSSFATQAEIGVARAEMAFRRLGRVFSPIMTGLRYFGIFAGGIAAVMLGRSIFNTIADFQQAQADLNAVMTDSSPGLMKNLSDDAKRLGLTTARSATEVSGLQTELAKLGYAGNEILSMTEAMVRGSVAMDASLDRTATLGGAMVRTFDSLKSSDMSKIMDQMTLSTLDTALSFEKLETMLPIVSGAANAVGVTFPNLLALLGKLSDAGIDASSSATALRNIFIDSRRRGHTYAEVLGNIAKKADKLTPAFNKFGKRGAVSAVVLAAKLKEVAAAQKRYDEESSGIAQTVMDKRLNTLRGSITLLGAAWKGFILTLEDGTGKHAIALKAIIDAARGMILLTAGTSEAMDAFKELNPKIQESAKSALRWLEILGSLVKWILITRAALWVLRGMLVAYNIILGVSVSLGWASIFALRGNALAMTIYSAATATATGIQKAFMLLMNVNPVLRMGLAILALVAAYEALIKTTPNGPMTKEEIWEMNSRRRRNLANGMGFKNEFIAPNLLQQLVQHERDSLNAPGRFPGWESKMDSMGLGGNKYIKRNDQEIDVRKFNELLEHQMKFWDKAIIDGNVKVNINYLRGVTESVGVPVRVGGTMGYGK